MTDIARLCVITVTYYPHTSDLRFELALRFCLLAARLRISVIIVDNSPSDDVRTRLVEAGGGCVRVVQQNKSDVQFAGKGGALRQAAMEAALLLLTAHGETKLGRRCAICFTEPEKVDLLNHVGAIAGPILDGAVEVVVPSRDERLFKETYPIEQYHSESFANHHFNTLSAGFPGFEQEVGTNVRRRIGLDWLFGPFAFRADLSKAWASYGGTSWDAQMVPYIRGVRMGGWKIRSVPISYRHPEEMQREEEGDPKWTDKRLSQLEFLFDLLGKEFLPGESFLTGIKISPKI